MPTRPRRRRISKRHRVILYLFIVLSAIATGVGIYLLSSPAKPTGEFIARVLFAETAGCSADEQRLVAGVMKNRVGNTAFGNFSTLEGVVRQPGAFSCIDDPANANWKKSLYPTAMSAHERDVFNDCIAIAHAPIPPAAGPSGRPLVYYHDKSITKPRGWDNDLWRAVAEVSTPHFVFYSIIPAGK